MAAPVTPQPPPRLFEPLELGPVTLTNRIVCAPHGTYYASEGLVTERQIAYYAARARGGAGMIVAGNWAAWPRTWASPAVNLAREPRALDGHRHLADAVHEHGTVLVAQLHEAGRQGSSAWNRKPLLAPSPLADPLVREVPKELERHEIDEMVQSFALSAAAMRQAGWDGIEVFAAQGYGLAQFLSPQTNRRTDRYGGDVSSRTTVVLEVLDRIRAEVGRDFLVGVRINGDDLIAGGLGVEDAALVAARLQESGHVDYLSVSGASNETFPLWIADMAYEPGLFVPLAAAMRQSVDLPLMVTTRIMDAEQADRVLNSGHADMVGMVRALIADPDLPRKALAGRQAGTRPCIACNQGCLSRVAVGAPMGCTVNPDVGLESQAEPRTALTPKRVVVVGGGPAGLQAAVTAAERGHQVVLAEAGSALGGQVSLAATVASRGELRLIVDHLGARARELGVEVLLGTRLDFDAVSRLAPDLVVLATGSSPVTTGFSSFRPSVAAIPGHDLPHVLSALDALVDVSRVGDSVIVVDDDPHGQATTVAEHLAVLGRRVTLVCRSMTVGSWSGPGNQEFLYKRLGAAGVRVLVSTWVDRIEPGAVVCSDVYSGRSVDVGDAATVVLATGNRVDDELYRGLVDRLPELEVVRAGDCLAPRRLDHAIWDGHQVGLSA